jgi:hypothetical protein
MMQMRRNVVPATVLLALLSLGGCSKKPEQTATALSSDNQSSATQPAANGATPDDSASNTAPASSTNAPAANSTAGASQQVSSPPPLVISAGTPITVRLQQRLSSASAVPGERFEAVIDEPVVVDDRVVVPVGALATGHVVVAHHSGRLHHPGELGLTLDSITVGLQNIPLATSSVVARGGSHKKRNWAFIGGGTGGGALIGALAAGGKGALIGSGIGAAAGTTTAFVTGKKDVVFGSERRLRFRLNRDINVSG